MVHVRRARTVHHETNLSNPNLLIKILCLQYYNIYFNEVKFYTVFICRMVCGVRPEIRITNDQSTIQRSNDEGEANNAWLTVAVNGYIVRLRQSNEKNYTTKLHDIANYLFKDNDEYKLHSFVFPLLCVCARHLIYLSKYRGISNSR